MIIDPSARQLPLQNWQAIVLHAERFRRAADSLQEWSPNAKKAVEYFEGKQWGEADLMKLNEQGRPALVINKIQPLVKLVMGYHINNQTDIKYLPGNDGTGTADIARVISQVSKQISEINELPYIDTEVFLDGLLTGRGYYDCRMNFDNNIFGNCQWKAADNFSVYPDPDGLEYDLNSGNYVMKSRWVSPDEVEFHYGVDAANMIRPLTGGMTFDAFPTSIYGQQDEVTPWRSFGGDTELYGSWRSLTDQFYSWVDTLRKTIRLLEIQHYVRTWRWFFVDLEAGDQKPVPDNWSPEQCQRVLAWAQSQGQQLALERKQTRRLRWTHLVGDIMVYDAWSDYDSFSIVPYFPYFRRGKTQGMVEPLMDSQDEINVRRSARINIIGRASNGGWKYAKGTLDAQQKAKLERDGGRPGYNMEWDPKQGLPPPEQITAQQAPISIAELEKEATNDMKEIAGINDSALGQVDQATISGRAILARQQQSVIGLEGFINNFHRTKNLAGRKQLEVIQTFYTTQRIIRVVGKGATPISMVINQKAAEGVINDVTLGEYQVDIGEVSLSDDFLAGQFNELMTMKQMGIPIPDDFIIDASSIGRKDELRLSVQQARQQEAAQPPAPPGKGPSTQGAGPGGSRTGIDGGSLPGGAEPGAPPGPAGPQPPPGQ